MKTLVSFFVLFYLFLCVGIKEGNTDEIPETAVPTTVNLDVKPLYAFFNYMYSGTLGSPYGVFFDSRVREIYVADSQKNLIGIFDMNGFPLFSFGASDYISSPTKVLTDFEGRIFVLDSDRTMIKIFSYRGELLKKMDFAEFPDKINILTMAIGPNGNIYIAEHNSSQIFVFDSNFKLKFKFGGKGSGRGQFEAVSGIAVDKDGGIFVTDLRATPVQVFDNNGRFLRGWGAHDVGPQNFSFPAGIAVDSKGRILVVDSLRQEIKIFNKEGRLIKIFGGYGNLPGDVAYPADIAIDPSDRIYIAEKVGRRVQVFEIVESSLKTSH